MNIILIPALQVLYYIFGLCRYILVIWIIASWLVAFGVINTQNPNVRMILHILERMTEPFLRPIRRILPNIGMLDLSPIVLFFILIFLQNVIEQALSHLL